MLVVIHEDINMVLSCRYKCSTVQHKVRITITYKQDTGVRYSSLPSLITQHVKHKTRALDTVPSSLITQHVKHLTL